MAEYIKFRLNAAKVGVSMALLALIAGAADKAKANAPAPTASQSSVGGFLKLTGLSRTISSDFLKLEQKYLKLNTALSSFEAKLLKFERSVSSQYYKARTIDATFLKIDNANATFLKIGDANATFLKIADANGKFLQGRGAVLSNSLLLPAVSQQQQLLGDGSVRVLVGILPAGGPVVTLANDTNMSLNFTVVGGRSATTSIPAGGTADITPGGPQLDIQMFGGGGGAGKIWTITLSDVSSQAGQQFVGQMLIGLL